VAGPVETAMLARTPSNTSGERQRSQEELVALILVGNTTRGYDRDLVRVKGESSRVRESRRWRVGTKQEQRLEQLESSIVVLRFFDGHW